MNVSFYIINGPTSLYGLEMGFSQGNHHIWYLASKSSNISEITSSVVVLVSLAIIPITSIPNMIFSFVCDV